MLITETVQSCVNAIEKRKAAEADQNSIKAYINALNQLGKVSSTMKHLLGYAEMLKQYGIISEEPLAQDMRSVFLDSLNTCGQAIYNNELKKETVQVLYTCCNTFNEQLASIWKNSGAKYAEGTKGHLSLISSLTDDPKRSKALVDSINATLAAPLNEDNIRKLVTDVAAANKIILGFSISPDVELFLKKVSSGRATMEDLTPEVTKWLGEHRLMNRLKIRF